MTKTPQVEALPGMTPLGMSDKHEAFDQVKPNVVMLPPKTLPDLGQFIGTENWFSYGFPGASGYSYTDGVKHVADTAGAYWLLDVVFSHAMSIYRDSRIPGEQKSLLVCRLDRIAGSSAALFTVTDGNDNQLASQHIEFTDFPAMEQTIWVQRGVAMLPSEY